MNEVIVYDAAEAAAILRCQPSWLKEQARRRKIPFTMLGGAYHWTPKHLAEIVKAGEQWPTPEQDAPVPAKRTGGNSGEVAELRARTPRRAKGAA